MKIKFGDGTLRGDLLAAATLADFDNKPNAATLYRSALARIDKLEIALGIIVGHGNITIERAKSIASDALCYQDGLDRKDNT